MSVYGFNNMLWITLFTGLDFLDVSSKELAVFVGMLASLQDFLGELQVVVYLSGRGQCHPPSVPLLCYSWSEHVFIKIQRRWV